MFSKPAEGSSKPEFQSWGRYPRLSANIVSLNWRTDFPLASPPGTFVLPVGLGRSYGDCCLLDRGTLLDTRGMNRLISFDQATGLLRCEGGVSLADILAFAVPRGWFLPVTPGTKYVTIGGAIANDIHGKNHHVAGCFGSHVPRFELVRSDGTRMECSPTENPQWYRSTIGGLGLTGLITWADLEMRPIVSRRVTYKGTKFRGLDEFLELSRASSEVEYTVAWIDCVSQGTSFARGIFMQGEHSTVPEDLSRVEPREPRLSVPVTMPAMFLNHFTVGACNSLYYHKQFRRETTATLDYEPFFFPLDSVLHWNRIYGRDGLLQFQCVLPEESYPRGMTEILRTITASGLASFLAVIKVFANKPSPGMMSFPRPGVTLTLDFPLRRNLTFELVDRLASITLEYGGCMYPAKDARMTPAQYQTFYPQWHDFARYIDPAFSSAFWQRVTANA